MFEPICKEDVALKKRAYEELLERRTTQNQRSGKYDSSTGYAK